MVDRGRFTWATIWPRVCFDFCRAIISPFLNSDRCPISFFIVVVVWEGLCGGGSFGNRAAVALLYENLYPSTLVVIPSVWQIVMVVTANRLHNSPYSSVRLYNTSDKGLSNGWESFPFNIGILYMVMILSTW